MHFIKIFRGVGNYSLRKIEKNAMLLHKKYLACVEKRFQIFVYDLLPQFSPCISPAIILHSYSTAGVRPSFFYGCNITFRFLYCKRHTHSSQIDGFFHLLLYILLQRIGFCYFKHDVIFLHLLGKIVVDQIFVQTILKYHFL